MSRDVHGYRVDPEPVYFNRVEHILIKFGHVPGNKIRNQPDLVLILVPMNMVLRTDLVHIYAIYFNHS